MTVESVPGNPGGADPRHPRTKPCARHRAHGWNPGILPASGAKRRSGVSAQTPFLEISDLSIAFDGVRVVEGLDLRLDRGESVALVGESGSGKSVTALSILQLLSYPRASHPSGWTRSLISSPAASGNG